MSPFTFLIHAHDHVWRDRRVPLRDRIDACQIIWEAAIRTCAERRR